MTTPSFLSCMHVAYSAYYKGRNQAKIPLKLTFVLFSFSAWACPFSLLRPPF